MSTSFSTISGDYYVGMKREDVDGNFLTKKGNLKEFDRIDKNKNGILGGKEICDERDKEANYYQNQKDFGNVAGGVLVGTGALGVASGAGMVPGLIIGSCGGLILGATELFIKDPEKITKETEKYRQQNKNSSIFNK